MGKPFGYELQQRRTVSNANNLTNEIDPRHLQNCISALGYLPLFLGFLASLRQQIGKKGGADFDKIIARFLFSPFITMDLLVGGHSPIVIEVKFEERFHLSPPHRQKCSASERKIPRDLP